MNSQREREKPALPAFFQLIIKMIKVAGNTSPGWFISTLITFIVFTLLLIADIHLIRTLLDGLTYYVDGRLAYSEILATVLLLGAVNLINTFINGYMNLSVEYTEMKVSGQMTEDMNEKAGNLDLIRFESAELYDDIEKAAMGKGRSFGAMEKVVFSIIFHGGYFLFLSIYFAIIKPELVLAITASFVPVAISRYIRATAFYKAENRTAPLRREFSRYEQYLTDRRFFKETLTLGAGRFFQNLYNKSLVAFNKEMWKTEVRTGIIDLGLKFLTLLGYMGLLLLLLYYLLRGEISPGLFGAVYFTMNSFFKWFEELFDRIGSAYQDAAIAGNYFKFMLLPDRSGMDVPIQFEEGITLEDVSFVYPGQEDKAVDSLTLSIECGEILAIVGENGAGKTTLVKLLCGMLLPDKGAVRIGNYTTADVSPSSLFQNTSAIFQNYQRYRMTVGENVSISRSDRPPLEESITSALAQAGMDLQNESFYDGLHTNLSREFGGTDLSGGQWQKIAIARGLYRTHNLIILDEPTAAIDPIEETEVYKRFTEAAAGKTAVLVTHRLGSARIANRIILMDSGRIVEQGSHESLLHSNGKYAEMFQAQAKWYDRNEE